MLKRLAHWMTRCMWRKIEDPSKLCDGPVLLTWQDAEGPTRHRLGVYSKERKFDGKEYGSGFVCWWTGKPLTDTMTHWAPPPLIPMSPKAAPQ